MSEAKSYAIGIIEIDPIADSQHPWVDLAGDDDTLEEVLARLAGRMLPEAIKIRHRHPSASPDQVVANLTELSADLALRLAEVRDRLATAGAM